MHKYKNKNLFAVVLELSSGRKEIAAHQEFETLDELAIPGIIKLHHYVEKHEPKQDIPAFGNPTKIDLSTELTKRFSSRFGMN